MTGYKIGSRGIKFDMIHIFPHEIIEENTAFQNTVRKYFLIS